MHTPYQSLARAWRLQALPHKHAQSSLILFVNAWGKVWNTIPGKDYGHGHVERESGPRGNSLGFIVPLIPFLWCTYKGHPQTDKLVRFHLRGGERSKARKKGLWQRPCLIGLYLPDLNSQWQRSFWSLSSALKGLAPRASLGLPNSLCHPQVFNLQKGN